MSVSIPSFISGTQGADLNTPGLDGQTALIRAIHQETSSWTVSREFLSLLACPGVNPNAPDKEGRSPLTHAVLHEVITGKTGPLEHLLKHPDIRVDLSDDYLSAALALCGRTSTASHLIVEAINKPSLPSSTKESPAQSYHTLFPSL